MYSQYVPEITPGSKILVGIGDSFTQGVGGYPDEVWRENKGKINCLDPKQFKKYMHYMYENSWVSQLCRNHLPDRLPINLGVMGTGNRAAAKELFLNTSVRMDRAEDVIVIYMMSGMERFDFVNKEFSDEHHFYTMWPNPTDRNSTNHKLWKEYARFLYSNTFSIVENIINIVDVQNFCKANGYKLVIATAFDQRISLGWFRENLPPKRHGLLSLVNWENFCHPRGSISFMQHLLKLDGHYDPSISLGKFYEIYSQADYPSKHITTCVHPTVEGYRVISEELYDFIKSRGMI